MNNKNKDLESLRFYNHLIQDLFKAINYNDINVIKDLLKKYPNLINANNNLLLGTILILKLQSF